MSKRKSPFRYLQVAVLIAAAGGVWWYENIYQATDSRSSTDTAASSSSAAEKAAPKLPPTTEAVPAVPLTESKAKPSSPAKPFPGSKPAESAKATIEKVNGYDRLIGTIMIEHRNNDGDSFYVRHGDREFELRLYYADSPEKYLSDRYPDQRQRVAEQARELGGLTVKETVAVGVEAKEHVAKLLKGQSFSVFTKWERVYGGERFYGFVLLPDETEWLCENLVDNGLARIHTKGERTPDGKSYRDFSDTLEGIEAKAKSAKRGAWR